MAKKIDWAYLRKSCETCQKARDYLDGAAVKVGETVDGTKVKFDARGALELLGTVSKLITMRGPKVVEVDLKKARPDDATLLGYVMGPTGNLRAPTFRVGKTLLVGFNPEAYGAALGV